MSSSRQPGRHLETVYDDSDPKHNRTYSTEVFDGVIVVRVSDDVPPVWTGAWPSTIPADAPGLSEYAIREINKLLKAEGA